MEKSTVFKASELAPAARAWIGSVLHVDLEEGDECELTLRRPMEVRTSEERQAARAKLQQALAKFDERTRDVPEAELEAAIGEAIDRVRSQTV